MTVLVAFLAAFLGYELALTLFPKLGLLDFPQRYGLKRSPIPYPAGIVAVLVFILMFICTVTLGQKELGLIAAIVLLAVVCFIDDRTPLPPWLRLLVQIVAATIVFATGSRIYSLTNPLGGLVKLDTASVDTGLLGSLPVLSGLFTIFWLLFTVNALNWLDGIPGQVSVISTIGFLMLGLLSYVRNDQPDIAMIAFVLAGIAGAGAFFDFPPAKLLIGDTGSMFFGFMLGVLGVYSGGKVATVFLALGIPLLDAAFVTLRRILRGHSPLRGGRDHLHHLLLDRGWSPRHIIALTAAVGTIFGGIALFLDTAGKGVALLLLIVLVFGLTRYAGKQNQRNQRTS